MFSRPSGAKLLKSPRSDAVCMEALMIVIRGGRVLDGGAHTAPAADLLIDGGAILEVGPAGLAAPPDAQVIDAAGKGPTIPLHCSEAFLTACRDLAREFDAASSLRPWAARSSAMPRGRRLNRSELGQRGAGVPCRANPTSRSGRRSAGRRSAPSGPTELGRDDDPPPRGMGGPAEPSERAPPVKARRSEPRPGAPALRRDRGDRSRS
jgi:hypothetical protein